VLQLPGGPSRGRHTGHTLTTIAAVHRGIGGGQVASALRNQAAIRTGTGAGQAGVTATGALSYGPLRGRPHFLDRLSWRRSTLLGW